MQSNSFYLTLPSNSSMKIFPDNTLTRYNTKLYHRLEFRDEHEWEVALVEIHYPYSFYNVTSTKCYILYRNDQQAPWTKITLPGGYYEKPTDVLALINAHDKETNLHLRFQPHVQRVATSVVDPTKKVQVQFSSILMLLLGFNPDQDLNSTRHARSKPDLQQGFPAHMYVYTDIIHPQMVGDIVAPLLRIVNLNPAQHAFGSYGAHVFYSPHYIPLQKQNFDQLEIDLRDSTGDLIPFSFGRVNVKLHFRRRLTAS